MEDLETGLFLAALHFEFGVDFRGFDSGVMHERLASLVGQGAFRSISALQGAVLRDRRLGLAAIDALSLGAAPQLTDLDMLVALRLAIAPVLRSFPWPALWLADCSDARLVILVAALLSEGGMLDRTQMFVTSASERVSRELSDLIISDADMLELEVLFRCCGGRKRLRDHCEARGDGFALDRSLRKRLTFHAHAIASDGSFREFQVIVCARAFHEYGPALRQRILGGFVDSLCPFGVLQAAASIDAHLTLPGKSFAAILPDQGVYRRLPSSQYSER